MARNKRVIPVKLPLLSHCPRRVEIHAGVQLYVFIHMMSLHLAHIMNVQNTILLIMYRVGRTWTGFDWAPTLAVPIVSSQRTPTSVMIWMIADSNAAIYTARFHHIMSCHIGNFSFCTPGVQRHHHMNNIYE
ncbi:hypothetical protein HZ326_23265 [Fusarium oxysporum f. sp. albedinis]|nr:hypothetical protein HZ326_23265 [Fusarium oxysporum f. sp. albedinis]